MKNYIKILAIFLAIGGMSNVLMGMGNAGNLPGDRYLKTKSGYTLVSSLLDRTRFFSITQQGDGSYKGTSEVIFKADRSCSKNKVGDSFGEPLLDQLAEGLDQLAEGLAKKKDEKDTAFAGWSNEELKEKYLAFEKAYQAQQFMDALLAKYLLKKAGNQ